MLELYPIPSFLVGINGMEIVRLLCKSYNSNTLRVEKLFIELGVR